MFLKHYYKFSNTKQMNKVFRFFIPAFSALLTIIATACNSDSSTDDFGNKNGATTEDEKTEAEKNDAIVNELKEVPKIIKKKEEA